MGQLSHVLQQLGGSFAGLEQLGVGAPQAPPPGLARVPDTQHLRAGGSQVDLTGLNQLSLTQLSAIN